ncbi:MAG TPA: hypothetical protein ENK43_09505, partial [Planctomycetes bacterium]|nr:hypothetical protein [Planctomycetota bacterium]
MKNDRGNPVKIRGIRELILQDAMGREVRLSLPSGGLHVFDDGELDGAEVSQHIVPDILFGRARGSVSPWRTGRLVLDSVPAVEVTRDLSSGKAAVTVGGTPQDLERKEPGQFLFGTGRSEFESNWTHDVRGDLIAAGPSSLTKALRADVLRTLPPSNTRVDTRALQQRRAQIEARLDELVSESDEAAPPPVDPPALGDVLEGLEECREVDIRLLDRRIEQAQAMDELKSQSSITAIPTSLLNEADNLANEVEELDRELKAIRKSETRRSNETLKAIVVVLIVAAAGLAALGHQLGEKNLLKLGLGLALGTLGLIAVAWLLHFKRLMKVARQARALRTRRNRFKEKARNLIRRLGVTVDPKDTSPDTLRRIADSLRERKKKLDIETALAPFIDTPRELAMARKLREALDRPLRDVASGDDDAPAAPLVRTTRAVLALAKDWQAALEENGRNLESHLQTKIRRNIELDLLEENLRKLLEAEKEAARQGSVDPQTEALKRRARQLRRHLLPELQRLLGAEAPSRIDDDLQVVFEGTPSASMNSFILTLSRLTVPVAPTPTCGRWLLDAGLGLARPEWSAFAAWLTSSPRASHLTLAWRDPILRDRLLDADPWSW